MLATCSAEFLIAQSIQASHHQGGYDLLGPFVYFLVVGIIVILRLSPKFCRALPQKKADVAGLAGFGSVFTANPAFFRREPLASSSRKNVSVVL